MLYTRNNAADITTSPSSIVTPRWPRRSSLGCATPEQASVQQVTPSAVEQRPSPLASPSPRILMAVHLLPVRTCIWHADRMEDLDIQCLRRSALIAQGIEHRFPKPCVAGSNPAGGTVRGWPILLLAAQTSPGRLPPPNPGCLHSPVFTVR